MLRVDSIRFAYDETPCLHDIGFSAEPGKITCLVGPSGCGKSTLLRLLAGLLPVRDGRIELDGETIAADDHGLPPEKRSVGLVFQEGALFPHLSVEDNVAFGLRDDSARVYDLLHRMQISELHDRYPHELSGGQRQRAALARALAPSPRVLLFDEPYANLDPALRQRLREQLRELVSQLDSIAVFVTHDGDDIIELADHVIALNDGRIVQQGTPRDLFDRPAHVTVARLFGQAQDIAGRVEDGRVVTAFGQWPVAALSQEVAEGAQLRLVARPDGLVLAAGAEGAEITDVRVDGADDVIHLKSGDETVRVRATRPHTFSPGGRAVVSPLPGRVFPELL